jgi:hypothetical protein
MKPVIRLFALCLLSLLGGCSTLLVFNTHALRDFQQDIKEQQFQKAAWLANHLPPSSKDYAAIQQALPELHQAEKQFVKKSLSNARHLADNDNLQAAIVLLAQANDRLTTPSDTLGSLHRELLQQQRQQTQQNMVTLLTTRARWLQNATAMLKQLQQQQQDQHASDLAKQLQKQQPELARQLLKLGTQLATDKDWKNSAYCLKMAGQLGARPSSALLAQVKHRLGQARSERELQHQAQLRQEAEARISRYNKSDAITDLLAARNYIRTHNEDDALAEASATIQQLSRKRLQHDIHLGDTFYANGDYQHAEQVWQQLAPLSPGNHELEKRLDRVARVLHSLQALKHSQGTSGH